jgi:hypothetical protein
MPYKCPKGHVSTDADYCSECGVLMIGAKTALNPDAAVAADNCCPDCGAPATSGMRFCEICRYDFQLRRSFGGIPLNESQRLAPVPPPIGGSACAGAPGLAVSVTKAAGPARSDIYVAVITDPSLVTEPDPDNPCPADAPERIFHLDLDENLVGRRSEDKGILAEIQVADPGVSRRHIKFLREPDRTFSALELGSANGTTLNGARLEPGVATPVKPGDQLIVGI